MNKIKIVCTCLFGLESVLAGEIKRMEGKQIETTDGRVSFVGDFDMIARANLNLRTAERVLISMGGFRADTFDQLFEGTKSIPFEQFIGVNDKFPVKGSSINSKLTSIPDCQSIVKKAMVERLKEKYSVNWFEETGNLFQIQFFIQKNIATIMIDTSGAGLHKRGYRRNSLVAPIKETLASGILDIARIYPDTILYDPFCGSGTFAIEAALKAFNIPSGIGRRFSAEKWDIFPSELWQQERERGLDLVRRDAKFHAYASDIDEGALALTRENAKKAGVSSKITISKKDISEFHAPHENSIVVCNPPYGERMLEIEEAENIYKIMGERFSFNGQQGFYIITPNEQFEKHVNKPATKRRKLYNGMIKCQLYMYVKSKI